MEQHVLVFCPGESNTIGLWLPGRAESWDTIPVASGAQTANEIIAGIQSLLKKHHLTLGQLTHVGAMTGPASYTQLRVFLATANTLGWTLKIPLFPITPEDKLPENLPDCLTRAKVNVPLNAVYPHQLG